MSTGQVEWHRRGEGFIAQRKIRKRLADPTTIVVHESWNNHLAEVPIGERLTFWADAQSKMGESKYSSFDASEFNSEGRDYLIVFHETC